MEFNRTKNSTRTFIFGVISRAITILGPFITRTIIIYKLGTEYLGLSSLFTSVLSILNMVPQVVHTTASIDRLEDLEKSKEPEVDGTPVALEGSLGVRLENLHFGYAAGRHEVLEGFSHDFEPGSKTAIMPLVCGCSSMAPRCRGALISASFPDRISRA